MSMAKLIHKEQGHTTVAEEAREIKKAIKKGKIRTPDTRKMIPFSPDRGKTTFYFSSEERLRDFKEKFTKEK